MKDNKKIATVIAARLSGPAATPDESSDELQTAAEEVLSAVQSNDATGLKDALKAMISMCMDTYETSEESPSFSEE